MSLVFLDPRVASGAKVVTPAKRLNSLADKRIGLLWNNRAGGDRFLKDVAELLKQKYRLADVYFTRKMYIGNPAPPEILDDLVSRVDAVVVGVGD